MNALTPPPTFNLPQTSEGVSAALNSKLIPLQIALSGLSWLQVSLGRVWPQTVQGKLEPWIQYSEDSAEYYRAYPNDALSSFSCLYCHDDEQYDESGFYATRTVSVIVWFNRLTTGLTVEDAKWQVIREINDLYSFTAQSSKDQTVEGFNGIYPGFDVSGLEERYLTYPYGGFRIETTLTYYPNLCY